MASQAAKLGQLQPYGILAFASWGVQSRYTCHPCYSDLQRRVCADNLVIIQDWLAALDAFSSRAVIAMTVVTDGVFDLRGTSQVRGVCARDLDGGFCCRLVSDVPHVRGRSLNGKMV